jgi:hypothetical protein
MTNSSAAGASRRSALVQVYMGVGTGCAKWSFCSGHGACDYCLERCVCQEGYGSPSDRSVAGLGIKADCSEREYTRMCVCECVRIYACMCVVYS